MRCRTRRAAMVAAMLAGGGIVISGPGTSCTSFLAKSTLIATDFCFIFDCQNGIFGGTITPCGGTGSGAQTIESGDQLPLFTDCPEEGP